MFYVSGWLLCCLAPSQLPAVVPRLNSSYAPVASSSSSSIVEEGRRQGVWDDYERRGPGVWDYGPGAQWEATDATEATDAPTLMFAVESKHLVLFVRVTTSSSTA